MNTFNESYIGLRKDLLQFIEGSGNTVLDVGCATGTNGKYLLDSKIATTVFGIEFDPKMVEKAEETITRVFCGDLNEVSFRNEILDCDLLFDYIVFGDILEHLYYPEIVLGDLKTLLKKDGKIIISLPNIAHLELFIQVYLKGTWPRNERGIFDNTHLRWFTKKDAFNMVTQNDLRVVKYKSNLRSRDALGSKWNWKYDLIKFFNKNLVTFQHILICAHE